MIHFQGNPFLVFLHPICNICVTMVPNDSFSGKSFLSFFLRSNLALVPIREPQGREGKLLGNQEDLTEDLSAVLYSVLSTENLGAGKSHYICNQHNDNSCFQYWKNCKKLLADPCPENFSHRKLDIDVTKLLCCVQGSIRPCFKTKTHRNV